MKEGRWDRENILKNIAWKIGDHDAVIKQADMYQSPNLIILVFVLSISKIKNKECPVLIKQVYFEHTQDYRIHSYTGCSTINVVWTHTVF